MRTGALLFAVLALAAPEERRQGVPGDRAQDIRVVRGQVATEDETAQPLRRVRVASLDGRVAVFTDRDGRFSITLPPTTAALRVTKPGYAPRHIRLDPSATDDLQIRLPRGGVIVGDVIDERGGPAVGIDVRVRRVDTNTGLERVPIDTATQTDDLGQFRVGSLPEGEYEVGVPTAKVTVVVRKGDDVGVALPYEARAEAVRAASSYAAGYEAGVEDSLTDPRLRRQFRGTAAIGGRVTDPFGRGVAGAIVRLEPEASGFARVTASDDNGDFQLTRVANGSYRLRATRAGLMPGEYGQARAGAPGRVVTVRVGQRLDDRDISLSRGAVVSGILSDVEGEPLEGLTMHAWQVVVRNGNSIAEPVVDVALRRTDDRGRYRLYGLQPGAYYVVASDAPASSARAGRQIPDAPRSYYPGVRAITEAAPVRVDVALDAAGADMTFRAADTVTLRGQAHTSAGLPLNRPVTMAGLPRPGVVSLPPQEAAMSGKAFEFKHVVPGAYVLQGMYVIDDPSGVIALESLLSRVNVPGPMDVGILVTSAGTTVSGRVASDALTPPLPGAWLDVMPADAAAMPHRTPTPWTVRVSSEGAFYITGLQGSMRFIGTDEMPAGWWLKSVEIEGRNAAVAPVSFGAPLHRRDVRIVLSSDGAEIAGRAIDGRKEPVLTYVAVVFPADTGHVYPGSRYVRMARPDPDGLFRIGPLPPADYWVAAVEAFDERSIQDAGALLKLRPLARRVSVSASQSLTLDLTLGRAPR